MKRLFLLACFMAITANSVCLAQSTEECNPEGNQAQMNACAREDFAKADRKLNSAYERLMNSLTPARKKKLLGEQRAWLKRRDPRCREEANDAAEGGSMWPMIFDGCRARVTQMRVKEIETWGN